jgi:hypothetical protein
MRWCAPLLHPSGRRFDPCRAHRSDQHEPSRRSCQPGLMESNMVRAPVTVGPGRRSRGSGSALGAASRSSRAVPSRVSVYAGLDAVTGRRYYLWETIPLGPKAEDEAHSAMLRLAAEVDQHRHPRTWRRSTSCPTATWRRWTSAARRTGCKGGSSRRCPPVRRPTEGWRRQRRGARLAVRRAPAVRHPPQGQAGH